ncbi:hypothetical protein RJ639_038506, partial [Escallonia herrerae]
MSNSSLSSSPARSSSTAIAGGNVAASLAPDELQFPPDLVSVQDRRDEALLGPFDKFNSYGWLTNGGLPPKQKIYSNRLTICIAVLKADLMAALAKEVKSLDEDNWMFEGPRSRIHLISRL